MKRFSCFLMFVFCLNCLNPVFSQEMSVSEKPTFDSVTTVLFPFDESIAPQTEDKTLPAVQGQGQLVPGRFGSAAAVSEGGIELPKAYNSLFDINHGSFEFCFKAPDSKWPLESHTFLSNSLTHGQPGFLRLWYWSDSRALRLDLHLAGDSGYITGALPNDNDWHHIAVTWDCDQGYCLYVDGVLHNRKDVSWTPIALPPDAQTIVIAGSVGNGLIDEVRLSKTARKNPAAQEIELTTVRQNVRVEDGRTMMTVGLNITNKSDQVQTVSADMDLTDYYQIGCGKKKVDLTLQPGQTETVSLDVPTDNTGPYLKLTFKGVQTSETKTKELIDEKLIFVDTLTGPRMRLDLNGPWEVCDGDAMNLTPPGPQAKWEPVELPHRDWTWNKTHTKWFRKRIVIPAAMQGKTISLQLSGVRFRADVFVNGKPMGGQDTDQMPFTVDITSAVKIGAENELLLAVTDWVSLVPPEWKSRYNEVGIFNTGPGGSPFIRPHGTMVSPAGIVDPIFIEATNPVAVDACYLTPSFRKSTLTVKAVVNNRTGTVKKVRLNFAVLDKDASILSARKLAVLKPGINEISCVIPVDLSKLTLWQIAKPYLYRFRTTLQIGQETQDQMDVRFGFREFWTDGPVFRLNGVPIRPVYTSATPYQIPGMVSTVTDWYPLKRYLGSCSNAYINLLRFHSKSFPILCYDAADEVGLMIVAEAIHTTIPCAYNWGDERLWKAFDEYYPRWVYREFNHPCVVIRSIENELGFLLPQSGPGANVGSEQVVKRTRNGMRALGRLVKKLDPSRPIMYHGSGQNFYDVADIYNVHYPAIGPSHHALAPVSSRWITMPIRLYGYPEWTWDRKKPLVIGEHDCCLAATPAHLSAIQGNDAYVEDWQSLAFQTHWPISVENLRSDGVTVISPWNPLTPVIPFVDEKYPNVKLFKDLLAPIVTFVRESRSGYFGGKQVARCLTTINDSQAVQNITVKWQMVLEGGKVVVGPEEITFTLQPTEIKKNIIRFFLPFVTSSTRARLQVETFADGKLKHTTQREFELFPNSLPKLNLSARYGWIGAKTDLWSKLNVPVNVIDENATDLTDIDVLLIAAEGKPLKNLQSAIEAFVNKGGRVVVFDPDATADYVPVKIDAMKSEGPVSYADDEKPNRQITIKHPGAAVTRVFPSYPDHPILKDLPKDRLRFWREDHITADATFVKPADGTSRTIMDCGHAMEQAALVEIPVGKDTDRGLIVVNTLPVLDLFDDQPAARILLGNLLQYVDTYRGTAPKPLGILADRRSELTRFMEGMGVEFFCLNDRLDTIKDFSAYGAIVVEADDKNLEILSRHRDVLNQYVRDGGVIWIHRPLPQHADVLNPLLPAPVTIKPLAPYAPIRITNHDLSAGIVNESLFWARSYPPYCGPTDVRVATNRIVTPEHKDVLVLADPEVMVSMVAGHGRWLLDEVTWDSEYGERKRAENFVRPILTNLNLKFHNRQPETKTVDPGYRAIDLTTFCNAPLVGGLWGSAEMGIKKLPVGPQVFKDALYTLVDPKTNADKGCVAFYSAKHNPDGVKQLVLPIDRKAAGVNLLITSLWTGSLSVKTPILNVDIEYTDGSRDATAVCIGRDVQDWYQADPAAAAHHPAVVWVGPESPQPGLYQFTWENPNPKKIVRSITLRPTDTDGYIVLFAASTLDQLPGGPTERFIVPGTQ